MHPFPVHPENVVEGRNMNYKPAQFLGLLWCGFILNPPHYVTPPNHSERGRTINSISKEIAEVTTSTTDGNGDDPVLHSVCVLDALRDNLDYVGYYGRALWDELDLCREILIRAVSWKAKIDNCPEKE